MRTTSFGIDHLAVILFTGAGAKQAKAHAPTLDLVGPQSVA